MRILEEAVTYIEDFFSRYHHGDEEVTYKKQQHDELIDEIKEYLIGSVDGEIAITEEQQQDLQEYIHWSPAQVDLFFVDVLGQESYTQLLNEITTDMVSQVIDWESTLPTSK